MTFKFLGIKITVSYIFCSCFCIMAICDNTGLFLLMTFAVLLHEAGHLLVMGFYDCRPTEIRLIPGSVQICSPFCTGKPTVLILLAGPMVNAATFALLSFLDVFAQFSQINLIYAVFNLLPFYGLDGGGVLEEIIIKRKSALTAQRVLKIVTFIGATLFFLLALLLSICSEPNYSVYIMALYFILSVIFKF